MNFLKHLSDKTKGEISKWQLIFTFDEWRFEGWQWALKWLIKLLILLSVDVAKRLRETD